MGVADRECLRELLPPYLTAGDHMPVTDIATTAEGRAVPIAAFESALKMFSDGFPSVELSDRQQDAMLEVIIELVSGGTTQIDILADHAIRRAAQLGELAAARHLTR